MRVFDFVSKGVPCKHVIVAVEHDTDNASAPSILKYFRQCWLRSTAKAGVIDTRANNDADTDNGTDVDNDTRADNDGDAEDADDNDDNDASTDDSGSEQQAQGRRMPMNVLRKLSQN